MRLNKYLALATGISRRAADQSILDGRVTIDGAPATIGSTVTGIEAVTLDKQLLSLAPIQTIMFHKPVGYVTSRVQQDVAPTIYELLPSEFGHLKPVGRLDKNSSGLLVLTNDGKLAQHLSHPTSGKWKTYEVRLHRGLSQTDREQVAGGVALDDGISMFDVSGERQPYTVRLQEGRNRQIRRTFAALGYQVTYLHRTHFGDYALDGLAEGEWEAVESAKIPV